MGETSQKITKPIEVSKQIQVEFQPYQGNTSVHSIEGNLKKVVFYQPIGVVVHVGGLGFGHYYTYLYDLSKNAWFIHNDDEVAQVEESQAFKDMNQNAYIILYSKQDL